jgi:hypothetical protein
MVGMPLSGSPGPQGAVRRWFCHPAPSMYLPGMQFMTRTVFASLSLSLALVGCGDDKGTTASTESTGPAGSSSSGDDSTTGAVDPTTGVVDPTTGVVDPTTGNVDPTTGNVDPTTGDVDPSTTTIEPETSTTVDATGTGGDPLQMCLDMVDGDACGECACNNCLEELSACQADEGCTAIRECAQEAMCGGLDCLGPCGDTINMYGGLGGPSAMMALALSGCADMACADQC